MKEIKWLYLFFPCSSRNYWVYVEWISSLFSSMFRIIHRKNGCIAPDGTYPESQSLILCATVVRVVQSSQDQDEYSLYIFFNEDQRIWWNPSPGNMGSSWYSPSWLVGGSLGLILPGGVASRTLDLRQFTTTMPLLGTYTAMNTLEAVKIVLGDIVARDKGMELH